MVTCATCGHENQAGSRFCNGCGAGLESPSARREERKTVSVVFADLVGSTARAEQLDPEDVRAILAPYHARLRHELERHGGTVEKFIGDAVVGVFGAPVTHEDDAERAVRAALAIQEAIAVLNEDDPNLALEVRIGVNTGEALVALDARPELGEAMVSGDVINTGARLQGAAAPGGVLVGDQTHRATERSIDYAEHPSVAAKGKAEPVVAWEALAARARFGLEHGEPSRAALIGRERELSLLLDAFERVRSDERPQLVTLVGVPGIGKSRLVHELWLRVDADPDLIVWRKGRSLPYGEGVSYWALGEIVKAQAGILESDGADVAAMKLGRAVSELVTEPGEAAWVERHLRALVGLATADGQPARAEAFAARRRFLETLAEQGPAVLVFEDVHWADDDLLDFVDELTDRLDAVPLLIVCTARPELLTRRQGWGGGKLNAVTLSLPPLSDEDTVRLLQGLLDRSVLPADTQAALIARAEGVPLFAEEYVRMLEGGDVGAELPETLQGIVAARIDGLAPGEKELLQDAAVLGKVFWTDALQTLSGLEAEELDGRLRMLERKEFVRRERRSAVEGARQYVFLHALVRDVAYGQIPRATRAAKHRATADWIAKLPADRAEDRAETLAHHLESAIAYGEAAGVDVSDLRPRAVAALRDAGDRAWALNITGRATSFYRRALEATPGADPDPELLFLHGQAVMWSQGVAGDPTADLEAAIDGLVAVGNNEQAALAAVTLARYSWNNQIKRPDLVDRALELIAGGAATPVRGEVLSHAATMLAIAGRPQDGLPYAEEAVSIARAGSDQAAEAHALNSLGVAQGAAGDLAQARASIAQALELALASGSVDVPRCYTNLATYEWELGRLTMAMEHHRQSFAFGERFESLAFRDWSDRELAFGAYHLGDWDVAVRGVEEHLAASRRRGGPHVLDIPLQLVGAAIVLARDGVLLREQVDEAVEHARVVGDPQTLEPALADAALLLAQAGESEAAGILLDEFCAGMREEVMSLLSAVLVWTTMRDGPFPARLLVSRTSPWVEAARLVANGDTVAAAELCASMGAVTAAASVRQLSAGALARTDASLALSELDLAAAFYRSVGATAVLAQVEQLAAPLRAAAS